MSRDRSCPADREVERSDCAPARLRNGYEYLEVRRRAWLVAKGATRPPLWRHSLARRSDEDVSVRDLLRSVRAYEEAHPEDQLVRFSRRDDVKLIDCLLLWAVVTDCILSNDARLGLRVMDLVEKATNGAGGLSSAIEYARRLRPEGPVVAEGLVEVTTREGSRWLDSVCKPLDRLTAWALPELPRECLHGGADDPASEMEDPFGPPATTPVESGPPKDAEPTAARLVLPPEAQRAFECAVRMIRARERCLNELGMGDLLPEGKGMAVLLYGPPGCGKTLAARVLARELDRPVRMLSSATLQSKWFGETEARIEKEVQEAAKAGAVLVFDEADSIVVDRGDSPHPAYRSATNALLRAVEDSTGVIVFTTNAADSMDPALERRLALRIEVPAPGPAERRTIWEGLLPAKVARADDVDLNVLASREMTGGEIKNAVLAALSEAAQHETVVLTRAHLEEGIASATQGRWTRESQESLGFCTRNPS